ncbi:hypothetical protein DL95DRAFT_458566 [Leptodontidium sp. 2 PMI_412]|nr:hypothetical protein DL95DRAFT_458566 [Leptodontidium sp. 2 PMI_412]
MSPSNTKIDFSSIPALCKDYDCRIVYLQRKTVKRPACLRVRSDCDINIQKGEKKFFKGTRNIDISIINHPDGYQIPGSEIRPKVFGFCSNTSIPIATVCQESRGIVAQRFTLAFGSESMPPTTWFDFSIDTLDWGFSDHGFEQWKPVRDASRRFSRHDLSADVQKIHQLVLNDGHTINTELIPYQYVEFRWENFAEWIHDILETFVNVQSLIVADADMHYQVSSRNEVRELVELSDVHDINETVDQAQMSGPSYHPSTGLALVCANSFRLRETLGQCPLSKAYLKRLRILETVEGLAEKPRYEWPAFNFKTITTKKRYDLFCEAKKTLSQLEDNYFIHLTMMVGDFISPTFMVRINCPLWVIVDYIREKAKIEGDLDMAKFYYSQMSECEEGKSQGFLLVNDLEERV